MGGLVVRGTNVGEHLYGAGEGVRIYGLGGDDILHAWDGPAHFYGGAGRDVAAFILFFEGPVTIRLAEGYATGPGGLRFTFHGIEAVSGSSFGDVIHLGGLETNAFSRSGDDALFGGQGNQMFAPGSGDDRLFGGAGAHDTVYYFDDGWDQSSYEISAATGIVVDLDGGTATDGWGHTDRLSGIEHVIGSQFDDMIGGDEAENQLRGDLGNDSLVGGAGNDSLFGGTGSDTINGGTGSDRLDGGIDPIEDRPGADRDVDVLILDGQAEDFEFIDFPDRTDGYATAIRHIGTGEVDLVVNLEQVGFRDRGVGNRLGFDNVFVEMARLSVDAYDETPARDGNGLLRAGWRPVHHLELGIPAHVSGMATDPGYEWHYSNGVFAADRLAGFGPYRASAQVMVGEKDGQSYLALAFRGTDWSTAWGGDALSGWGPQMTEMYERFAPLTEAVQAFVRDHGIQHVLVTGHSLGASFAQYFMQDVRGDARYVAATFGSPGAAGLGSSDDPRITHFSHGQDIVVRAGRNAPGFSLAGEEIRIPVNDPRDLTDDGISIAEHSAALYATSLENLAGIETGLPHFLGPGPRTPGFHSNWAAGTAGQDRLASDNVETAQTDNLFGRGGADAVFGGDGDDLLYGGAGNDRLFGDEGADLLVGGAGRDTLTGGWGDDIMIGGQGRDVFVLGAAFGHDTIRGFEEQDVLRLPGGTESLDVRIAGNNTILTHAQGQITLLNYIVEEGWPG